MPLAIDGKTTTMLDKNAPLYLGRCLEEWLGDLLSPDYVDGMEFFPSILFNRYPEYILLGFREAQGLCDWNTNLVCQALPCFGNAFVEKAKQVLPDADASRQARLAFCVAQAAADSTGWLIQRLELPAPEIRVAACCGLAEVLTESPQAVLPEALLRLIQEHLHEKGSIRPKAREVFKAIDSWLRSSEGDGSIQIEISTALLEKLRDSNRSVRLGAAGALYWATSRSVRSGLGTDGVVQVLSAMGLADAEVLSPPNETNVDPAEIYSRIQPELLGRTPSIPLAVQEMLGRCSQFSEITDQMIADALHDQDIAVRIAAVRELKRRCAAEPDLGQFLLQAVTDPCRQVRTEAIMAIHRVMVHKSAITSD